MPYLWGWLMTLCNMCNEIAVSRISYLGQLGPGIRREFNLCSAHGKATWRAMLGAGALVLVKADEEAKHDPTTISHRAWAR